MGLVKNRVFLFLAFSALSVFIVTKQVEKSTPVSSSLSTTEEAPELLAFSDSTTSRKSTTSSKQKITTLQRITPLLDNTTTKAPDTTTSTVTEASTTTIATVLKQETTETVPPVSETISSSQPVTASTTPRTLSPTTVEATTSQTQLQPPPQQIQLTEVELRIVTLVNALRTNPAGPLRREKALPSHCPIASPLSAFHLDLHNSEVLSRNWALQMAGMNHLQHRPFSSQEKILRSSGVNFTTAGENIAWIQGYSEEKIAQTFFQNWRDSDSHYCNLVHPDFTHFTIGVYFDPLTGKYWAVQNFYG